MRGRIGALLGLTWLAVVAMSSATGADSDTRDAREREMLRRAQEALRQSQADNAELAQQKVAVEEKLKTASGQVETARSASKSAQATLRMQLDSATAAGADLTRQLGEANQQIAELTSRQKETATQLGARESQLKQVNQQLEGSQAANSRCEAKNLQLYQYSQELVARYEKKGVWSALTQKDPVLGIKEVGIENVVQEYREKIAGQRIQPSTPH